MVARSNFGFSMSFNIFLLPDVLKLFISSICEGVKEKKAISDPDIKPEQINNKIITSNISTILYEN